MSGARLLIAWAALLPAAALANGNGYYGHGWHMMDGWGYGFHWIGMLFWLLILFLFFFAILRLTGPGVHHGPHTHVPSPQDIVRRRYARGEITKEQMDEMLRNLEE